MCGGCRGKSENRTPEGPQGTSITGGDSARHVCNPRAWKGRSEDWVTLSREGGSGGKESACDVEDPGSIRVSGGPPGEGNG